MESDIWTEKYRPKDFSDVRGQNDIIDRIKSFVENKNMPHLLFTGPAGTGKSSLSLVIVKKMFGDGWRDNYLELNASDERGIEVVRQKVKDFARTKALTNMFKIIFLDEADALTRDAQHALRRTMENYANSCRFILSCNFSSKIIDPIQSRCAVFRFKLLKKEDIISIIETIAKKEGLEIDSKAIDDLYGICGGDCRRVVNLLQATSSVSKKITEDLLYNIIAEVNPQHIREILETALKGNFVAAKDELLDTMLKHGLAASDVIKVIQKEIWSLGIDDEKKVQLTEKTGEIEFRIVEGSDEFIQLEALLAQFVSAGRK
jgi:replication factor C small subunit